jgi:outer membrane protein OmpA-like peptidoglycan-associated protein
VITPASDRVLDQIVNLLREDTSLKLSIQGHTDNVGSKAANLDLSKRRADAVKAALVSRGIDAGRLTTDGFGDTKPVADNAAEPGRARNRRVELVKQ